ncbi:uncharacterized protein si:dkey-1h6.8 isoform X2 [Brienomyrus brachyistius]|nr:uncharacterized protein si:dkey-1h6.8 isoform X2 [Brienomyrus brachyistius]XP_048830467.1 uncharacterized protein si:dkey-1h6.8 isoform X2 [Brienomyrus brachyistius]
MGSTKEAHKTSDGSYGSPAAFQSGTKKESLNAGQDKKRWGWKRCFSPSLFCLKGKVEQPGKVSDKKEEQCDVISCNAQPMGSVGHGDVTPVTQRNTSDIPANSVVRGTGRFSAWGTLKRLLRTSNYQSRSKERQPEQKQHSASVDTAPPRFSFKDKLSSVLRRRAKKPSPFFQEKLVGTNEYIEEENIVLSNRCTDEVYLEASPVSQEGDLIEGDTEIKGSCSETLTISAEVTAVIPTVEEDQDISGGSTSYSHPEDLTSVEGQKQDEDGSPKCAEEGPESCKIILIESSPVLQPKDDFLGGEFQEELPVDMDTVSINACVDVGVELQEEPLQTEELSSPMTGEFIDARSEQGVEHEKVLEGTAPPGNAGSPMQDYSPLKNNVCNHVIISLETSDTLQNGTDKFPLETLQALNTGGQLYPTIDGLLPQPNDILLRQTACALVQAAMTAALNQLKEEMKDGVANIHREKQELQSQA